MSKQPMYYDRKLVTSPIQWCVCLSPEAFNKAQRQLNVPKAHRGEWITQGFNATVHHIVDEGREYSVVCYRPDSTKSRAQQFAMLVHEAVHIWQRIRESMGETTPSCEFEAYSIQSISQDLMQALDTHLSKKRVK